MTTTALPPDPLLPVQLTAFVGREAELRTVRELQAISRLLTLTGAGGSGKTRLALEAVRRMAEAGESRIAWVELAPVGDPASLGLHIATALGLSVEGSGSVERALVAALRERPPLLVLDNCEHLVDACARLVEMLLQACPALRVLATSREALGIGGERSWLVPALSLPPDQAAMTPEEAGEAEAVRLFVERAREVLPEFELTAANAASLVHICKRLDGLPLAIELAAARVNVLPPEQIAERLDDRFALLNSRSRSSLPRHRTLRAAVDWSYELLSGEERLLLERLAVFAGGFTLGAAEQVCAGDALAEPAVLDLLASLTIRSLVTMQEEQGRARYRLLETIREYAAGRASERVDGIDVAERHALYFLGLVRAMEPDMIAGRQHRIQLVDVEYENIRAALGWSAFKLRGTQLGLPLAWALMWYWYHRQLWHEGFRQFETALASAVDPEAESRAAALMGLGLFGLFIGKNRDLCRDRLSESESIWRAAGNQLWLSFTLVCRSIEARQRGGFAEARCLAEEAMAAASASEEAWAVPLASIHALVPVLIGQEEWLEARRVLIDGERVAREREDGVALAYVLDTRAYIEMQLGNHALAASLACRSLHADPREESHWLAGRSLRTLGAVAVTHGRLERAVTLFGAAERMYELIGADSLSAERRAVSELPERLRAAMPAGQFEAAWEAGRQLPFQSALRFALAGQAEAAEEEEADRIGPSERRRAGARSAALVVNALGPLEILLRGEPAATGFMRHTRPRELLLYLLTHPDGRSREEIGVDFWPEVSPAQLKNNFHVTLHHLRRAIGSNLVRHENGRYRLDVDAGIDFDAERFERKAGLALAEMQRVGVGVEAGVTSSSLADALELYRGPFGEGEKLGDWHLPFRERLAQLQRQVLMAVAANHEALGETEAAESAWRRLVLADSFDESAVRRLMRLAALAGRRHEALRCFHQLERELDGELGVAPEPATVRLAEQIRSGQIP